MVRFASILSIWLLSLALPVLAKHPKTDSKLHAKDFSKEPHTIDGEHNPEYDQYALFGDEADDFRGLPDSDKEYRIRNLHVQADGDHDGFLDEGELSGLLIGDALEQLSEYGIDASGVLTWIQYVQHVTGTDGEYEDKDEETLEKNLKRDRGRWHAADFNHDGVLNRTEAAAFFNAESHPKMQDVIVQETVEELDKNHDGHIDEEEYIKDLLSPSVPSDEEPHWIKEERKLFKEDRDKNHDGKLDPTEIKAWLFPPGEDHVKSEVVHLMSNCDTNKDMKLSEEELVDCYETLIGSPITNYGELFADHDEL